MTDDIMEPREQECRGRYLYGAGFYAREDEQVAILRGESSSSTTFCQDCQVNIACERAHRARAAELLPEEVEEFEREVVRMKGQGGSELVAAAARMRQGRPDPFAKLASENFVAGVTARRARDGSALLPKRA